jgi:alginate O-acetyltransferase complex protein AlgI
MLFNDLAFLFVFLPCTLAVVLLLAPRAWRPWALIAASLMFYGAAGVGHAMVLVVCVVWVHLLMNRVVAQRFRFPVLLLAIAGPLSALIHFKYLGFLINDVLMLGDELGEGRFDMFRNVVLPAGISFFTFQLIGYAIDRYRGVIASGQSLRTLLLFVSFFPQLVAGPIVRFAQVAENLRTLSSFALTASTLTRACIYFCFGLAFKVLLADSINNALAPLVASPDTLGTSGLLSLVYTYTFQIYFDFYGYSLCAIGLALLFGIELPANFLRPYSTLNPRDFWRCWHVSLSMFIRDYLYIPLGGNRNYLRNILVVFLICGLWHGAGYAFIIWGAFHFAIVGCYNLTSRYWDALPVPVQWFLNFTLVSFGWLLFIYPLEQLSAAVGSVWMAPAGAQPSADLLVMSAVAAVACFAVKVEAIADGARNLRGVLSAALGIGTALMLTVTMLFIDRSATFIYFRF